MPVPSSAYLPRAGCARPEQAVTFMPRLPQSRPRPCLPAAAGVCSEVNRACLNRRTSPKLVASVTSERIVALIQASSKQKIPKQCKGYVEYTVLMHTATLNRLISLFQPPDGCCEGLSSGRRLFSPGWRSSPASRRPPCCSRSAASSLTPCASRRRTPKGDRAGVNGRRDPILEQAKNTKIIQWRRGIYSMYAHGHAL